MAEKAKIIAFCGLDGCGKSTQLRFLQDELMKQDQKVNTFKVTINPFNEIGKSKAYNDLVKVKSGLQVIKNYVDMQNNCLSNYDYILCDRHLLCYLAYAYALDVKNIELVRKLLIMIKNPDLTFYFDIDPETSMQRIVSRNEQIQKNENIETLRKAQEGYKILLKNTKNACILDAKSPADETKEKVYKKVLEL